MSLTIRLWNLLEEGSEVVDLCHIPLIWIAYLVQIYFLFTTLDSVLK